MSFTHIGKRCLSTLIDTKFKGTTEPRDFCLWRDIFTVPEQHILLATSLQKLDSLDSRPFRRRRNALVHGRVKETLDQSQNIQGLFLPDEYYQMEEGHYDGVIHHYREMHVTSWPENDVPGLSVLIDRLRTLCPTPNTQTHILHLASNGEILPHIDNLHASGTWILGVSLGAERIMRMESTGGEHSFDVLLPSGSVYLQRNTVRFGYKHSILKEGSFLGREIKSGPRLSIMIRDRLSSNHIPK